MYCGKAGGTEIEGEHNEAGWGEGQEVDTRGTGRKRQKGRWMCRMRENGGERYVSDGVTEGRIYLDSE